MMIKYGKLILDVSYLQMRLNSATLLLTVLMTDRSLLRNARWYVTLYGPVDGVTADAFEEYWNLAQCIFSNVAPFLVQRALTIY